jgi:glucose uptake protein GlcU
MYNEGVGALGVGLLRILVFFAPWIIAISFFIVSLTKRMNDKGEDPKKRKKRNILLIISSIFLALVVAYYVGDFLSYASSGALEHQCENPDCGK